MVRRVAFLAVSTWVLAPAGEASAQGAGGGAAAAEEAAQGPAGVPAVPPAITAPIVPAPAVNPAIVLRDEMMYLKVNQGFTPLSVYQNGRLVPVGFFGGAVERYFGDAAPALDAARSYRRQRIIGFTLWLAGLSLLVADLGWELAVASSRDPSISTTDAIPFAALLVAGTGLGVAGGVVFGVATSRLAAAVNLRNAWLLNRFLPVDQQIDLNLYAVHAGAGLRLAWRF